MNQMMANLRSSKLEARSSKSRSLEVSKSRSLEEISADRWERAYLDGVHFEFVWGLLFEVEGWWYV
jgi:hypothetical protein